VLAFCFNQSKPLNSAYAEYKENQRNYSGDIDLDIVGFIAGVRYELKDVTNFKFANELKKANDSELICKLSLLEISNKKNLDAINLLKTYLLNKPFNFYIEKHGHKITLDNEIQNLVFYISPIVALIYSPFPDKDITNGEVYSYEFSFQFTYMEVPYKVNVKFNNKITKIESVNDNVLIHFSDNIIATLYNGDTNKEIGSGKAVRVWVFNSTDGMIESYNLSLDIDKIEFHLSGGSFFAISGKVRGKIILQFEAD